LHRQFRVNWDPLANAVDWIDPSVSANNLALARNRVKTFECPSGPADVPPDGNIGETFIRPGPDPFMSIWTYSLAAYGDFGRTNYVGVAGLAGVSGNTNQDQFRGVFVHSRTAVGSTGVPSPTDRITPAAIQDGTSQTLMFGEVTGRGRLGASGFQGRQWNWLWFTAASLITFYGVSDDNELYPDDWNSRHPGIVLFANADGSVRSIRRGINWSATPSPALVAFRAAGSIRGGEVIDTAALGD
jgi:hypothetical protein